MGKKQSIGRAQADALANGFIDGLGEAPQQSDVPLNNTLRQLILLAAGMVKIAQDNLSQKGHVSSGNLADSIKVLNPESEGKSIKVEVEAAFYSDFINNGVKGTKIKGTGKYSFRTSFPSKNMVDAIRDWMKASGLGVKLVKTEHAVGKLEQKNAAIAAFDSAYAMARSIKQKGIKRTGYFDDAFNKTNDAASKELGEGFALDVFNAIPYSIGGDAPPSP